MEALMYSLIFLPMAGALFSYRIGRYDKKLRNYFVCIVTVLEFILAGISNFCFIKGGGVFQTAEIPGICGMGLTFEIDGFRIVYVGIAAFSWMCTALFSVEYFAHYRNRNRYYLFQLITLGATAAIFLSADLYTTFVFFEVMSFASYVWVAQDERAESLQAAATYLAVAVIGGLVMLMGLFMLYEQAGTLAFRGLQEACQGKNVYPAAVCMLVGFGAKAGAFPLHIWLPKAHPVAPAPASALLSGILTKTGIFGILMISCRILVHDALWGSLILLLGVLTMVTGAVLALFSVDLKRTLACSSVSQIGFILVGVGMQGLLGEENRLAAWGTFLHMQNHSLFKLVLFTAAGVVYRNLHKLDLNEIRGFGRKKPLLKSAFFMGALGIGGVPLFSGYVSKTLLHESIVEYAGVIAGQPLSVTIFSVSGMRIIEWLFLISGGFTVAYMMKLFAAVFVEQNRDAALQEKYDAMKKYMTPLSAAALTAGAVLFPIAGIFPKGLLEKEAAYVQDFMGVSETGAGVKYFSLTNLKGALISIAIGMLLYFVICRRWMMEKEEDGSRIYADRWPKLLDLETIFYRPVLLKIIPKICGCFCGILDQAADTAAKFLLKAGTVSAGFFDVIIDAVVVFLRKTVYRDSPKTEELNEGNIVTYLLGKFANGIRNILNSTFMRKNPDHTNYEHKFALVYSGFKENASVISRSLSYGLIIFSLGLCATLIYLLFGSVG